MSNFASFLHECVCVCVCAHLLEVFFFLDYYKSTDFSCLLISICLPVFFSMFQILWREEKPFEILYKKLYDKGDRQLEIERETETETESEK